MILFKETALFLKAMVRNDTKTVQMLSVKKPFQKYVVTKTNAK